MTSAKRVARQIIRISARRGGRDRDHAFDLQGRTHVADRKGGATGGYNVLGGVHATFMYRQVLAEAPWIDVIVRGEGEEVVTELVPRHRRGQLAGASEAQI